MDAPILSLGDSPISDGSKNVVLKMIRKHNNSIKESYEKFTSASNEKFKEGNVPNTMYGEVIDLFSKLIPIEETLDKIKSAKNITNHKILDNLIYDNVMQINTLLNDNILELPEVEGLSANEEIEEYEQALIQIFNHVPNIRDNEKREDLLWTASLLTQTIESAKSGGMM